MSDLISRQWLMECVEEGWIKFDTQKDESRFVHLIRDIAPSERQWIPYDGENIPSPGESVLVTYKCDDGTSEVAEGVWIQPFIVNNCFMEREVIAWMPLPEPYKDGDRHEG